MLVLDHIGLQRIAELRARAEAAPMAEADVLLRLRRRQSGRELPDPPAMTVALLEDYLVAFAIEDWPDDRWRRLTVSTVSSDPRGGLPALLKEFGFVKHGDTGGVPETISWRGPLRSGRRSLTICELIEWRQPAAQRLVGASAEQMIVDHWSPVDGAPGRDGDDPMAVDLDESEEPADEC
jgi:hypothetical protein